VLVSTIDAVYQFFYRLGLVSAGGIGGGKLEICHNGGIL
jgi:hypothetical protein